jgi:MFS family permease
MHLTCTAELGISEESHAGRHLVNCYVCRLCRALLWTAELDPAVHLVWQNYDRDHVLRKHCINSPAQDSTNGCQNSAASAGLATGGFIWFPLSHKFGRSSVIFWALTLCLASQIWAPKMTGSNQYVPYLVSRYFSGFSGQVVSVLGPRCLTDMFFLHQRGRAFTVLHFALNFGASAGPTFSGFIAANHSWTIEYWWSVGLISATLILVFLTLEETGYDRTPGAQNVILSDNFLTNRIQTFLPGNKTVGAVPITQVVSNIAHFISATC